MLFIQSAASTRLFIGARNDLVFGPVVFEMVVSAPSPFRLSAFLLVCLSACLSACLFLGISVLSIAPISLIHAHCPCTCAQTDFAGLFYANHIQDVFTNRVMNTYTLPAASFDLQNPEKVACSPSPLPRFSLLFTHPRARLYQRPLSPTRTLRRRFACSVSPRSLVMQGLRGLAFVPVQGVAHGGPARACLPDWLSFCPVSIRPSCVFLARQPTLASAPRVAVLPAPPLC